MKNAINTILLLILLIKIIRFQYLFHNAVPHRNKFLKTASDTCHHMHQTIIYFRVHLLHAKFHGKICTCMYHKHVSSACIISIIISMYHQHVSSALSSLVSLVMPLLFLLFLFVSGQLSITCFSSIVKDNISLGLTIFFPWVPF